MTFSLPSGIKRLIFTDEFFVDFEHDNITGSYINFQNIIRILIFMHYAYHLHKSRKFCYEILENWRRQLDFAVVFQVNDSQYQNILWTQTFANPQPCIHCVVKDPSEIYGFMFYRIQFEYNKTQKKNPNFSKM